MRSHSALYVDVGYLIAAAATRSTGSSLRRGIEVDYPQLLADLIDMVEERTGLPLLRVYWYDAARDGKATYPQEQIALLPRVKLRLGRLGVEGEQKGVDLRIGLDMVGHARNGAVDSMILLSGDDDLTEAVEEAQAHGVQVVILSVPTRTGTGRHGVSRHLMLAADDIDVMSSSMLDRSVTVSVQQPQGETTGAAQTVVAPPADTTTVPSPKDIARLAASPAAAPAAAPVATPMASPTRPPGQPLTGGATLAYSSGSLDPGTDTERLQLEQTIRDVAANTYEAWATTASAAQLAELRESRPSIPRDLDRALLIDLSEAINQYTLSDSDRFALRGAFWDAIDNA